MLTITSLLHWFQNTVFIPINMFKCNVRCLANSYQDFDMVSGVYGICNFMLLDCVFLCFLSHCMKPLVMCTFSEYVLGNF